MGVSESMASYVARLAWFDRAFRYCTYMMMAAGVVVAILGWYIDSRAMGLVGLALCCCGVLAGMLCWRNPPAPPPPEGQVIKTHDWIEVARNYCTYCGCMAALGCKHNPPPPEFDASKTLTEYCVTCGKHCVPPNHNPWQKYEQLLDCGLSRVCESCYSIKVFGGIDPGAVMLDKAGFPTLGKEKMPDYWNEGQPGYVPKLKFLEISPTPMEPADKVAWPEHVAGSPEWFGKFKIKSETISLGELGKTIVKVPPGWAGGKDYSSIPTPSYAPEACLHSFYMENDGIVKCYNCGKEHVPGESLPNVSGAPIGNTTGVSGYHGGADYAGTPNIGGGGGDTADALAFAVGMAQASFLNPKKVKPACGCHNGTVEMEWRASDRMMVCPQCGKAEQPPPEAHPGDGSRWEEL